jgi:hypothetical protein
VDSDPSRNRDRLVVSVALASTVALVALVGRALVALVGGALVALVGGALIVVALVALVGGALVALVGRALIVVALVALVGLVGGALIVVALVAVAGVRLVALVVLDPSSKVTTSRAGASVSDALVAACVTNGSSDDVVHGAFVDVVHDSFIRVTVGKRHAECLRRVRDCALHWVRQGSRVGRAAECRQNEHACERQLSGQR